MPMAELTAVEPEDSQGRPTLSLRDDNDRSGTNKLDRRCLEFVEAPNFQYFIGVVICANIFVLAGETDHEDWAIWWYCDNCFLVIFLIEILLRLAYRGLVEFLCGAEWKWGIIDMAIVALGISELWVPLVISRLGGTTDDDLVPSPQHSHLGGHHASLIRFLRLLRLLRICRFFRMVKRLMNLLKAFQDMMSSFVLIFSILFFTLFSCAIICTHLLGHGEGLPRRREGLEHVYEEIQENFRDIPTSVFTLFQITTTDNWVRIADPVIDLSPMWQIFFIVFICFSSWTMISVLTAVASDSMVMATLERGEAEAKEQEAKRHAFIEFLRDKFYEGDVDGNGYLDKQEFEDMIMKETTITYMRELGITSLSPDYLLKAWDMLDVDDSGELTIDEFVLGLSQLSEELSTKHVVSVDTTLKRVAKSTGDKVNGLKRKISSMKRNNEELLGRLQMQEQMHKQQQLSLKLWREWALSKDPGCLPKEVIRRLDMPPTMDVSSDVGAT